MNRDGTNLGSNSNLFHHLPRRSCNLEGKAGSSSVCEQSFYNHNPVLPFLEQLSSLGDAQLGAGSCSGVTGWSKVLSTELLSSLCSLRGLGRPSPPSGFTLFRTQEKIFDGRKASLESWLLLLAGCSYPLGFCESCNRSRSGWWHLGMAGSGVER